MRSGQVGSVVRLLPRQLWFRLAAVLVAVAALTALDFRVLDVNSATAAFSFLVLILVLATWAGLRESITASLASVLVYNFFFLPPIGAFTIADPQNWVALFAFLATAVIGSQLSSNSRRRAEQASRREQEVQRLYDFSRALILGQDDRSLAGQIAYQVAAAFDLKGVWLYEANTDLIFCSETQPGSFGDEMLHDVAGDGCARRDVKNDVTVVPVQLGGARLGSLGVAENATLSNTTLQAIAQLVAIALERARAQAAANLLEVTRENEQLKSTLLDALAHEFKTPLTSVKVATTTLLARRTLGNIEQELVTVVDEEADRLNHLVTDAIELARIGTSPLRPSREMCSPEQLISSALAETQTVLAGREMDVRLAPDLPQVNADRRLSELVLRQLVNNALKYSLPGSPINIEATVQEGCVQFRVTNVGPIIPKAEQNLIFAKFYRSPSVRNRIAGTGMGLSISREIVEAQGGRVWVTSADESGTQFFFTLPTAAPLLSMKDFTGQASA